MQQNPEVPSNDALFELQQLLDWYESLPEPGLVPEGLNPILRGARLALATLSPKQKAPMRDVQNLLEDILDYANAHGEFGLDFYEGETLEQAVERVLGKLKPSGAV